MFTSTRNLGEAAANKHAAQTTTAAPLTNKARDIEN